jgi:hypothetical protein
MKSLKVVFLIIVIFGLLPITHGAQMAGAANDPFEANNVGLVVAAGAPQVPHVAFSPVPHVDLFGSYFGQAPGKERVLVVAADGDEFVTTATKDLNIMCRIFDKELKLGGARSGGLYFDRVYSHGVSGKELDLLTYALGGGGRNTSCMYLQGYAAVFLMSVSFPLAPGPTDEKEKSEPNEPADVVWRQAEQELYGQPDALEKRDDPGKIYDAAKVEEFQANLLKTFRHAANTRCLAPDEWVIVVVCGPGHRGGAPKMLALRAKKSDIDGFQKGTLNLEQFREKVKVVTSGNPLPSWSPGSGRSGR